LTVNETKFDITQSIIDILVVFFPNGKHFLESFTLSGKAFLEKA